MVARCCVLCINLVSSGVTKFVFVSVWVNSSVCQERWQKGKKRFSNCVWNILVLVFWLKHGLKMTYFAITQRHYIVHLNKSWEHNCESILRKKCQINQKNIAYLAGTWFTGKWTKKNTGPPLLNIFDKW